MMKPHVPITPCNNEHRADASDPPHSLSHPDYLKPVPGIASFYVNVFQHVPLRDNNSFNKQSHLPPKTLVIYPSERSIKNINNIPNK